MPQKSLDNSGSDYIEIDLGGFRNGAVEIAVASDAPVGTTVALQISGAKTVAGVQDFIGIAIWDPTLATPAWAFTLTKSHTGWADVPGYHLARAVRTDTTSGVAPVSFNFREN